MKAIVGIALVAALASVGCAAESDGSPDAHLGHDAATRDGGDASRPDVAVGSDAATPDAAGADGATDPFDSGSPIASGASRGEICGNGFDDDGNGLIDDGCDCAVGTHRTCWTGPPANENVGACHDGVQNCNSTGAAASWALCDMEVLPTREILANGIDDDCDGTIDEPDGICVPTEQRETSCADGRDNDCDTRIDCADPDCAHDAHCVPSCAAHETLCWGGVDDDCDGLIDCADPDCASDPSCATGPCPHGQTPTYTERDLGTGYGASGISRGDGQATMPMTCQPTGGCPTGQVAVVLRGEPSVCVPPPPACAAGQSPTYVASGMWRCDLPCSFVIHYGSLFGGRYVCAGNPPPCTGGQAATFIEESQAWQCRPRCDNTTYDQVSLAGTVVCVPC